MTVNKYFSHNKFQDNSNEQDLVHGFVTEAIQQMGFDMIYVRRETVKLDEFFGEDVLARFTDTWEIEMYLEDFEGFQNSDVISMFGIDIKDQATFHVARRRFVEVTGMKQPMEGDLLYFPQSETLFEIRFVEDERQFFPLGTLPSWKLKVEFFNFNSEEFETGRQDIDDIIESVPDADNLDNALIDDSEAIDDESQDIVDRDDGGRTVWGEY